MFKVVAVGMVGTTVAGRGHGKQQGYASYGGLDAASSSSGGFGGVGGYYGGYSSYNVGGIGDIGGYAQGGFASLPLEASSSGSGFQPPQPFIVGPPGHGKHGGHGKGHGKFVQTQQYVQALPVEVEQYVNYDGPVLENEKNHVQHQKRVTITHHPVYHKTIQNHYTEHDTVNKDVYHHIGEEEARYFDVEGRSVSGGATNIDHGKIGHAAYGQIVGAYDVGGGAGGEFVAGGYRSVGGFAGGAVGGGFAGGAVGGFAGGAVVGGGFAGGGLGGDYGGYEGGFQGGGFQGGAVGGAGYGGGYGGVGGDGYVSGAYGGGPGGVGGFPITDGPGFRRRR